MACDLTVLLTFARDEGASDLHISPGLPPIVRLRGAMTRLEMALLTPEQTHAAIYDILNDAQKKIFEEHRDLDFAFEIPGVSRFRANVFRQQYGDAAVFRVVPTKIRTLEELAMPKVLRDLAMKEKGLVLVTGPTGSGKTTTLATMIDFINTERADHIITIEDPIEYYHKHKKCLVTQRELGVDVPSVPEALRRALRQDPDVVLVGEMRDLDTIAVAITAAETGHLVFATLHTTGSAETINRIVDVFPTTQQNQIRTQLAATIIAVISQVLLPTADGKGRIAAFELMFSSDPIKALMRKGETYKMNSHIQTSGKEGMILLDDFLFNLWTAQRITYNTMMRASQEPDILEKKVREYTEAMKRKR